MLHSSLFMSAVIMIVAAGVGFLLGYIGQRVATQRMRRETEERTRHILHEAEKEAESKKREASLEAQASWYQAKAGIEQEAAATKLELQRLEKKILLREENIVKPTTSSRCAIHQVFAGAASPRAIASAAAPTAFHPSSGM